MSKGMRCLFGIGGALIGAWALASGARAEVSADVGGSVLVFPKIEYDGGATSDARDTIIQIANRSNNMVHAHCFYVNGQLLNPDQPPGPYNPPLWQVTDFYLWLTKQQPTHWEISQGRQVNASDSFGTDGAGLDPGAVPPVPAGFQGELKCVQVDSGGNPYGGNDLQGNAVLRRADGDVSKYNALAILANPDLAPAAPANELLLDNSPLNDGEYNACPNSWLIDHFADGADNPVLESLNPIECADDHCPIRTYLTLVPCSEDFENNLGSSVTVQFKIFNEFEVPFSTSTTVACYLTTRLADIDAKTGKCTGDGSVCVSDEQCIAIDMGFCSKNSVFSATNLGTATAFTTITPVDLDGGVLAVMEQLDYNNRTTGAGDQFTNSAWAAWNPQNEGNRYDETAGEPGGPVIDVITVPQL